MNLAPALDGKTPVDLILNQKAGTYSPFHLAYVLDQLHREGLVVEAAPVNGNHVFPEEPVPVPQCLDIHVVGNLEGALIRKALPRYLAACTTGPPLALVFTCDALHPALSALDQQFHDLNRPWLLVKPVGLRYQIGPLFDRRHACFACFRDRLERLHKVRRFLEASVTPLISKSKAAPNLDVLTEVAGLLAQPGSLDLGTLLRTQAPDTGIWENHPFIRPAECPHCSLGEALHRPSSQLMSHEETAAKMWRQVGPVTGLAAELRSLVTEPGQPFHLVSTGYHPLPSITSMSELDQVLANPAMGKGAGLASAQCSAMGEMIERACSAFHQGVPMHRARFTVLGKEAVHPHHILGFSKRQYAERERQKPASPFDWVPAPFCENEEVAWTPLWSHTAECRRYLPTGMVYMGFSEEPDRRFFQGDSNGCAAGQSLEDALVSGFLELVERDAAGIWWYNRLKLPGMDLPEGKDTWRDQFLAFLKDQNRETWVLNLTNDLGIPVFAAVSRRIDSESEQIALGFSAHFEAEKAIRGALLEMGQVAFGFQEDPQAAHRRVHPGLSRWLGYARLADHPFLVPEGKSAMPPSPMKGESLWSLCLYQAHRMGLEVLSTELTRPEIGVPVARVVVPGLRHFWKRLGPGRLYEVPVNLGWCSRPNREEDMNPIPFFL